MGIHGALTKTAITASASNLRGSTITTPPVPGDQAPVRLRESALPRPGQEYGADGHVICPFEPVDGSPTFTGECRRGAPVMRGMVAARHSRQPKIMKQTTDLIMF